MPVRRREKVDFRSPCLTPFPAVATVGKRDFEGLLPSRYRNVFERQRGAQATAVKPITVRAKLFRNQRARGQVRSRAPCKGVVMLSLATAASVSAFLGHDRARRQR